MIDADEIAYLIVLHTGATPENARAAAVEILAAQRREEQH